MTVSPQELGEKLRRVRENYKFSQEELGKRVGVEQRVISELENGKRKMGALELLALSKALEISPAYFFDAFNLELTDHEKVLIEEFRMLRDDNSRWTVINVVRELRKGFTQDE